jgi:hypothetical protein
MSHNDLTRYIEDVFSKQFGNDILGVINLSMIPHEAFIQVRVIRVTTEVKDFAKAIEKEFDELGRRVSIDVVEQ